MAAPMKDVLLKHCCAENIGIMNRIMKNVNNCFMQSSPNKLWMKNNCNKHFVRRNQNKNNQIGQDLTTRCDLYIPYGILRAAGFDLGMVEGLGLPTDTKLKIETDKGKLQADGANLQLASMMSNIKEKSQKWILPVSCCSTSHSGSLNISICRQQAFQKVLQMVEDEGRGYGCKKLDTNEEVLLHHAGGVFHQEDTADLTLTQLRALLICNHLERVLTFFNHKVHPARQPTKESSWIEVAFGISQEKRPQCLETLKEQLWASLAESKYRVLNDKVVGEDSSPEKCSQLNSDILLDVSDFVKKQRKVGKIYSKNIKTISGKETGSEVTLLHELSVLESVFDFLKPKGKVVVLHVTGHDREYRQQCLDILCRICSRYANMCEHVHLVHGQVQIENAGLPATNKQMSAQSFFNLRSKQMRKASEVKHGDTVKGKLWDARITNLTAAAVRFELLGICPQSTIKLDLGDETDGQRSKSRDGVFVMYNYARLSTLFKKFEERANKGYYPPLPNIKEVDFSLLKEEDEWHLLFQYILPYPDVITELLQPVFHSTGPRIQLQTHKICVFLVNLSRDLSAYYSRTHVLSEPRAHLLPAMFARLHLLKAVQQIMYSSFQHLNIQPLQEM